MTRPYKTTRFDRYVHKAKDHPVLSIALFLGLIIITLIGFWERIEKYVPMAEYTESSRIYGQAQEGEITVTGLYTYDIYYPARYRSSPNLVFPEGYQSVEQFEVIEQRPDGFKVNLGGSGTIGSKIKWKATGVLDNPS